MKGHLHVLFILNQYPYLVVVRIESGDIEPLTQQPIKQYLNFPSVTYSQQAVLLVVFLTAVLQFSRVMVTHFFPVDPGLARNVNKQHKNTTLCFTVFLIVAFKFLHICIHISCFVFAIDF